MPSEGEGGDNGATVHPLPLFPACEVVPSPQKAPEPFVEQKISFLVLLLGHERQIEH